MLLCLDCCESRDDERNGNEVRKEHPTAASVDTVLRLDMKLSNLCFAKLRKPCNTVFVHLSDIAERQGQRLPVRNGTFE